MKNCFLCCNFSKSTHQSGSEKGENKNDVVDVWSEILLNVDPYWIFKCILVSKEWLQVITSCCFRRKYLKRWKGCFPVIGFMHDNLNLQLVAANKLGDYIGQTKLMRGRCRFLSKSSSADGLILCIDDVKNTMYVFNTASSGGAVMVTPLPPPPTPFRSHHSEIISTDTSFKVIIVAWGFLKSTTLSVQTFCSSRWMWERSELSCCDSFCLSGCPGIGSSKGVVYWPCLGHHMVEHDTNSEHIRLISGPVENYHYSFYDIVSPGGNLQCATIDIFGIISIWELSGVEWRLLYTVDTAYVCWQMLIREKALPERLYSNVCFDAYFVFVSFVPGRSDSIFLARGYRLFVYSAHNQQLDEIQVPVPCVPRTNIHRSTSNYKLFVPLTVAESGVWPSTPSSNHGILP